MFFVNYLGWDAVTGLGTPNYGKIESYVKKLINWNGTAHPHVTTIVSPW